MSTAGTSAPYRVGEWLPSDQVFLDKWLEAIIQRTHAEERALHPAIADFQNLIESDSEIFMLFNQMFEQVPKKPPYNKDPTGKPQVRNYRHMLQLLNTIMTHAPEFNESGLVGCPINTIFDWSMGTAAGFAAFLNERVNAQLKQVLNGWGRFLSSSASTYVLNRDPHQGLVRRGRPKSHAELRSGLQVRSRVNHIMASNRGMISSPGNSDRECARLRVPMTTTVIVNACESAPYKIAHHVKQHDRFWIKSQPYSIVHMLANDSLAPMFVGGTVYQAYLSPLSYHRWHSPVSGTVMKAYVKDGTYYSEAPSEGFDPVGPNDSQAYITAVATRALIFIEADNPDIGLMCVLPVGMAEVSTCQMTVYEGQHVRKGDQIGMFHFGGSTHCLIFRPGVNLEFDLHGQKPGLDSKNIPVNSRIATVMRR